MKRCMILIAILAINMFLGVSVAYADDAINVGEKSVSVRFVWDDLNNQARVRPDSVAVVLKANGDKMYTKMVESDTWSDTFHNLVAYIDGEEVKYSIDQYMVPNAGLPSEYIHVSTIFDEKENCYIITNKYREGQVIDTEKDIVEDTYVDDTVGEDVIEEVISYQGIEKLSDMAYGTAVDMGERLDETPKTMDMYYVFLITYRVLMVILFMMIGYCFLQIRNICTK